MRLATWNVNSALSRLPRLLPWLDQRAPDVVCLQETKLSDEAFAESLDGPLAERGYGYAHVGEGRWNGVAILSRVGLDDVQRALPGAPAFSGNVEARAVTATCGGLRVTSVYVPNGRTPDDPHYAYKLEWLAALRESVTAPATSVVAGDMNIAPTDADVWDPALVHRVHARHARRAEGAGRAAGRRAARRAARALARRADLHLLGLPGGPVPPGQGHADRPGARGRPTRPGASPPRGWTGRRARGPGRATTRR